MLAVLNHRASAYEELHVARTKLMTLRNARSGLFVKKRSNPFSCEAILSLLADIAAAKLNELRLMLSLDGFEKQLRDDRYVAKQKRIWLGSVHAQERAQEQAPPPPRKIQRMDNMTAFLLTTLFLRGLQKPRI